MITLRQLRESFDTPAKAVWNVPLKPTKSGHVATYMVGGNQLGVFFEPTNDGLIEVVFEVDHSINVTGDGNQMKIIATVLSAIREYVTALKPPELKFTAMKTRFDPARNQSVDTGRIKLYDALIAKFAAGLGYTLNKRYKKHPKFSDELTYVLHRTLAYPSPV